MGAHQVAWRSAVMRNLSRSSRVIAFFSAESCRAFVFVVSFSFFPMPAAGLPGRSPYSTPSARTTCTVAYMSRTVFRL